MSWGNREGGSSWGTRRGNPAVTRKAFALVAVPPAVVTLIDPVWAPSGTPVTRDVVVPEVTVASVPLNRRVFADGVGSKLCPEIVTVSPTAPLVGANPVMAGGPA